MFTSSTPEPWASRASARSSSISSGVRRPRWWTVDVLRREGRCVIFSRGHGTAHAPHRYHGLSFKLRTLAIPGALPFGGGLGWDKAINGDCVNMNGKEGMRRLALLLGVVGAILCGLSSYSQLRSALDQRERHNRFEQLASADVVKKLRASLGKPSIASPGWNVVATEVHEQGIKTIHWTGDYRVGSIETEDGQTLSPAPAPPTWTYLLVGILPAFGFFVPWGAVRAIEWVGAGYKRSPEEGNSGEIPAEMKAQLEGPWKEALERHTDEVR